jgi:hypothetical protein
MKKSDVELSREIIQKWLELDLLSILEDSGVIPQICANLPHDIGRGSAMRVKKIQAIRLGNMTRHSLNQTCSSVDAEAILHIGIDLTWDEYERIQEVRELVGECEEEFVSTTVFFDTPVMVSADIAILSEPPMVTSFQVKKISGVATSIEYQA